MRHRRRTIGLPVSGGGLAHRMHDLLMEVMKFPKTIPLAMLLREAIDTCGSATDLF